MSDTKYTAAIGRRKTAIARVRLFEDKGETITVNGMPAREYFNTDDRAVTAAESLKLAELPKTYSVTAIVRGGGKSAQADAIRMGIARAATMINGNTRTTLKQAGYLKRDPRAKERKKPGLKKARKAPQWSKR